MTNDCKDFNIAVNQDQAQQEGNVEITSHLYMELKITWILALYSMTHKIKGRKHSRCCVQRLKVYFYMLETSWECGGNIMVIT